MSRLTAAHLGTILARVGTVPTVFVESGTFHGKTTRIALARFPTVYTIELHDEWYQDAVRDLAPLGARCYHGNSAVIVPSLAADLTQPVCWYLDAHFFRLVPDVAGEAEGLPLWAELRAIAARPYHDIVIVDDVSMFGKSEPTPEWETVTPYAIAALFPSRVDAAVMRDQFVVWC